MPLLEFFRQYTLREYMAVLVMAAIGAGALVFMLNTASGGSASDKSALLLKRETARANPAASVRSVEAQQAAAARRAKERARVLAKQRKLAAIRAARAARRAAVLARARAAAAKRRTRTVRRTPAPVVNRTPTRVVNTSPTPAPRPQPAPAPKPTPKQSGSGGGGGGSFDDSG